MDFHFTKYHQLLKALLSQGFLFDTVANYFKDQSLRHPLILLRHDVEAKYANALKFASIQSSLNIKGSYYFRSFPKEGNQSIIKEIASQGHEIGYHYDDLSFCKGDHKAAIKRFEKHLNLLREIAPVQTITMEGAPLSKYDNKDLWKYYNYRDYGIIAEPYFDLSFGTEFNHSQPQTPNPKQQTTNNKQQTTNNEHRTSNKFFYLTDTGRKWDGWRVSVRDKVPQQEEWIRQGLVFRSTSDIIKAATEGRLPDKIMMTFHPQRWTDKPLPWIKELLWQGVKNLGKRVLVRIKD